MAIKNPTPKSFKDLILDRSYSVPPYQRPFEWEVGEQISELWEDISRNDPPYFLGVLILELDPHDPNRRSFRVVDGQQRLATLLLLLRAAIEVIQMEQPQNEDARDLQSDYIFQQRALEGSPRPTLVLSKRDKDKFESLMKGEQIKVRGREPVSWRSLEKSIKFFRQKFEDIKKENGVNSIKKFIKERVFNLSFVDILLDDESDVYQFFETLNDRGMALSIADLVKNKVCAQAVSQGKPPDDSAVRMDEIAKVLGGETREFFLHYCWSKGTEKDPVPRRRLMKWYSDQIQRSHNVGREFLDPLEDGALRYSELIKPSADDLERKEVFKCLEALGATRCYPLVLVGYELLDEGNLQKKDFLKLCKALEVLVFRHSTILKRDAKVLEGVFYRLARDLRNGSGVGPALRTLSKQEAMGNDERFKLDFIEFKPRSHKVARYVLWKIEEHEVGEKQAKLEWDALTLEHILARDLPWDGKEEYLERLGNMTLLSEPWNRTAGNRKFKEKREKIYKKEKRIKITMDLANYKHDFKKEDIESRQRDLSKHAAKVWNREKLSRNG